MRMRCLSVGVSAARMCPSSTSAASSTMRISGSSCTPRWDRRGMDWRHSSPRRQCTQTTWIQLTFSSRPRCVAEPVVVMPMTAAVRSLAATCKGEPSMVDQSPAASYCFTRVLVVGCSASRTFLSIRSFSSAHAASYAFTASSHCLAVFVRNSVRQSANRRWRLGMERVHTSLTARRAASLSRAPAATTINAVRAVSSWLLQLPRAVVVWRWCLTRRAEVVVVGRVSIDGSSMSSCSTGRGSGACTGSICCDQGSSSDCRIVGRGIQQGSHGGCSSTASTGDEQPGTTQ